MTDKQIESSIVSDGIKVPQFRRDIFPTNVVFSAANLCEVSKIIGNANDKALQIELSTIDQNADDKGTKEQNIKDLMKIEYTLLDPSGDTIQGLGFPALDDFSDKLSSFFISSSTYPKRAVNSNPLNYVDAFFSFSAPSLKLDLITFPSNPTENSSVINVVGRDENWVRATADKLEEFFESNKTHRPVIHGSGVYDLFLYGLYLPVLIATLARIDKHFLPWFNKKTVFFNVISSIYTFFLVIIVARLLFQTIRWLFPPIEYYKSSRTAATSARVIIGTILAGLSIAALYDFIKYVLSIIF